MAYTTNINKTSIEEGKTNPKTKHGQTPKKTPPKEIPGNESSTKSRPSVSMTSMSRPFSRRLTQPLGGPLLNGEGDPGGFLAGFFGV